MASREARKETTGTLMMVMMRALLILWLCSGCCVCDNEYPSPDFSPQRKSEPEVPVEETPAATESAALPPEDTGEAEGPSQVEEGGSWADSVDAEDEQPAADEGSDQDQGQSVQDQSEAPETDEESSAPTEETPVESKATSSSSEMTAEPSDQTEELGDFIVRNDDGVTICLRACFAALLNVNYLGEDDEGKVVNRTAEIPVPEKANVGGWCGHGPTDQAGLILQWDEGKYILKFTFQKQNSTRKGDPDVWEASRIQFTFDTGDYTYFEDAINPGTHMVHTNRGSMFFVTPQGNSRVCDTEDDITMVPADNKTTESVTMELSQLKMQPYGLSNGTFSEGVDCGKDLMASPNTNVASIAVGATLACLILVVIIVYAIGRKMGAINDRTGYKSVD